MQDKHCQVCCLPICHHAKQWAQSAPRMVRQIVKDREGVISQNQLCPSQEVCLDHFICLTKGRLYTSCGTSKESNIYVSKAIFINQLSGYIHMKFQKSLTSCAILNAKDRYKEWCCDVGVIPKRYLSDNGSAFTSHKYWNNLSEFNQIQRFACTGAHHHNSQAEQAIQTIMSISCAMLMHNALH